MVRHEMIAEVDIFNPFIGANHNRCDPSRSFSQYYKDAGTQEKMSPTSPPKEKFFNKTWRNRLKVIPNAGSASWIPQDDFSWSSAEGSKVQLTNTPLSALSEAECIALQRVSQTRLKLLNLKSHITIPKGIVQK
ncbi:PREDICTED: uncharacterized protein LOC107344248 isoform X3 [Acropora digitifera]|uniref:uncharacterized protein LOC107344248 isoform X3 n=1 Tax=Acropora digitifera TaxID=70779 RepID=UPI00077A1A4C|nr:PREDICTED: uncharacterized protein LOC107344248 isoform X3 [Acropora digitifera]